MFQLLYHKFSQDSVYQCLSESTRFCGRYDKKMLMCCLTLLIHCVDKFVIPVCVDIQKDSVYQSIQSVIWSKTGVLQTFKNSPFWPTLYMHI